VVRDVLPSHAGLQRADPGARLGAYLLDALIFFGMVYVPFLVGLFITAALTKGDSSFPALIGFLFLIAGLAVWLVMTFRNIAENGQSIAKKIMGIKVVRSDGSPVSLGRIILLRNLVNMALGFVPFYALVDILFIFNEQRQCLHDKIADTIVINA
jgi:uncharacterized RDD family membrane protein YckC